MSGAGAGSDLIGVGRRLERWRRAHGGRGRRIPAQLWAAAVDVARVEGVEAAAHGLRMSRAGLQRRLAAAGDASETQALDAVRGGFVEIDTGVLRVAARAVVQLHSRDGEQLRVELYEVDSFDVAALARVFLSRGR